MKSSVVVVWLVIAMLATACSGDEEPPAAADPLVSPDAAIASSLDQPSSVSSSGALQVVVFGMRNGTTLSMLDTPGGAVVGQIEAGANNVYFTGEAQTGGNGELLWQVEHDDAVGWVPPRFGYPALRENVSDQVATAFGATNAAQDTAVDTALVVSGLFSFTSPPTGIIVSRINQAEGSGHVVIDVVDQSAVGVPGVLGYRIEVMSELSDTDRFEIKEVWRTAMCQNGTSAGACV